MNTKLKNEAIKRAIDSYPGGICFSTPDGRVILVNNKLNDLVLEITGHTVLNAETVWDELIHIPDSNHIKRLTQSWLPKRDPSPDRQRSFRQVFFRLPNNSIWRFESIFLDEKTIQTEAADISSLYKLSEELYENSIKLREMQERQGLLLENIVQVNQNKELLAAKMRIHDELGKCLLATNKAILAGNLSENSTALKENWNSSIQNFLCAFEEDPHKNDTLQTELMKVAELIGCKITFQGSLPSDPKTLHLLYAAIREALTNAVRHANATNLFVEIKESDDFYHVEISDNGYIVLSDIKEGTGLSTLRKNLEQSGASMSIQCIDHVILMIDIPINGRKKKGDRTNDFSTAR